MKNSLLFLLLFCCYSGYSQSDLPEMDTTNHVEIDTGRIDTVPQVHKYKFVLGVGWNIVDNTSTRNNHFLDWAQHYNAVPFLSKISLDRSWNPYFATNAAFTYSQLKKEKYHNGETIEVITVDYLAFDVLAKLYIDQFILKSEWLDVHICAGLGINSAEENVNQTYNAGVGMDFWIFPKWGLRFQTLGKWALIQSYLSNNHIQHSAEVLYRF